MVRDATLILPHNAVNAKNGLLDTCHEGFFSLCYDGGVQAYLIVLIAQEETGSMT